MSDVHPQKTPQSKEIEPHAAERLYAAIEIGSTGIRLIVAAIDAKG